MSKHSPNIAKRSLVPLPLPAILYSKKGLRKKTVTVKRARRAPVKPVFGPKRILVPLDFSELGTVALERAAGLAGQYDASLLILHVVEPIIYPVDYLVVPREMEEGNLVLFEKARDRLNEIKKELAAENVKAETDVRIGKPYLEITELAKKRKIDLVVLATHGHKGLKHFYLGSTAEKVVRHSPCSVLVVR